MNIYIALVYYATIIYLATKSIQTTTEKKIPTPTERTQKRQSETEYCVRCIVPLGNNFQCR